jgi:2-polyprenyl-6-methoxyphenol hydroxylase-like FAD-dependent oxidoreductase
MHRGALFELLYAAVLAEGVEVRCGVSCESLTPQVNGKRSIIDAAGTTYGPHDLVIVADGARSSLRDDETLTRRVTPYPYGALWYVAEAPAALSDDTLMQTCDSTQRLLGLLPTGLGPRRVDGSADRRLVTLFWSVRVDRVDALRARGLDAFCRDAIRVDPRSELVVAQLRSMDDLLLSTYLDVVMDHWHAPSLVYLGDAGHAMSPQLGQGANMALLDAYALAHALTRHTDRADALAAYARMRRWHVRLYQTASWMFTPVYQSDSTILPILRDRVAGPLSKIPPAPQILAALVASAIGSPLAAILGRGAGAPAMLPSADAAS